MISDAMPERRNLVVASFAFIVFYAAGGYLATSTLNLPAITLSFERPGALTVLAWLLLAWFTLRFWQASKNTFLHDFSEEARQLIIPPERTRRLLLTAGVPERSIPAGKASHVKLIRGNWHVSVDDKELAILRGRTLWSSLSRVSARLTLTGNTVANFVIPYVLAAGAAAGPLWSLLLN